MHTLLVLAITIIAYCLVMRSIVDMIALAKFNNETGGGLVIRLILTVLLGVLIALL